MRKAKAKLTFDQIEKENPAPRPPRPMFSFPILTLALKDDDEDDDVFAAAEEEERLDASSARAVMCAESDYGTERARERRTRSGEGGGEGVEKRSGGKGGTM